MTTSQEPSPLPPLDRMADHRRVAARAACDETPSVPAEARISSRAAGSRRAKTATLSRGRLDWLVCMQTETKILPPAVINKGG